MKVMSFARTLVFVLANLTLAVGFSAADETTACERSARDMARSCQFEASEELNVHRANCRQFQSEADRQACRDEARSERQEALQTCGEQLEARKDTCALLGENRYVDPLLDGAITFIDPNDIGDGGLANNPYVILEAGHTHVLSSEDELVIVYATEEVRDIQGVLCRVVIDFALEEEFDEDEGEFDYTPIEITDDWFAQDIHNNVYYCGEVARNFEDGVLRDLDGSFEGGIDFAKAGFLTLAMPAIGQAHRQEYALGEAEDIVQYLDLTATPTEDEGGDVPGFPCADACLKTFDFTPLEPESTEFKYYLPNVGFVLAIGLEDGGITGEREELVCTGDSLAVLAQDGGATCGIEDPEELLDTLCEEAEAFCEDDD